MIHSTLRRHPILVALFVAVLIVPFSLFLYGYPVASAHVGLSSAHGNDAQTELAYDGAITEALGRTAPKTIPLPAEQDPPFPGAVTVSGQIFSELTNEPIAGAWARFCPLEPFCDTEGVGVQADENGQYVIDFLTEGAYTVRFNDYSGWHVEEFLNEGMLEGNDLFTVVAGGIYAGVDMWLSPAAILTGTVRAELDDSLIESSTVTACRSTQTSYCEAERIAFGQWGGEYRLDGLPPGAYYLRFEDEARVYATEFYSNVARLADATPVTLSAGINSPVHALLSEASTITGTMYNPDGSPAEGGYVNLCSADSPFCDYLGSGYVHEDGSYTITGVGPGTYHLLADPSYEGYLTGILSEYYDNAFFKTLAEDVVVGSLGAYSIDPISLDMPGAISGTVTGPNGPLGGMLVEACYVPDGSCEGEASTRFNTYTSPTGTFLLPGLVPGDWLVYFADDAVLYQPVWYNGAFEQIDATPVEVVGGMTSTGIDANLLPSATSSSISGKVTGPGGLALADIAVTTAAWNGASWSWNVPVWTNGLGEYTAYIYSTGTYIVEFWDSSRTYLPEYYDDAADESTATEITISSEGTSILDIDAELTPGSHITGTVTNSAGEPIPDILIFASVQDTNDPDNWLGNYTTISQVDGTYDLPGLPAGNYRLGFQDESGIYRDEYYNDKPEWEQADEIVVGHTDTMGGIDAQLASVNPVSTPETPSPTATQPTQTATAVPTTTVTVTPATLTATPTSPSTATSVPPTLTPTPPTPTPPAPTDNGSVSAQPDAAATLSLGPEQGLENGQQIDVEVPAGAVGSPTTLVFEVVDDPPTGSPAFKVGDLYFRITAVQDGTSLDSFVFEKPVRLTITYRDEDVADLNELLLKVFFFDETISDWSDSGMTVLSRDPDNNRIVVEITHLTIFALVDPGAKTYLPSVVR